MTNPPRRPMTVDLSGAVSIVTGAGTGIGRALAVGLARCGSRVVVSYCHSRAPAQETVALIQRAGGEALPLAADVTKEDQVAALVDLTRKHYGGLDILVANAGGPPALHPTAETPATEWQAGLNLNLSSAFYCVKHGAPLLPEQTGRIILTSSMAARTGGAPGMLAYAAAKGAINTLVRSWAKEFAPRGITVNALSPGIVWTRIHQEMTSPADYKKLIDRIPLGYDGTPEDMVGAVLLLASQEGRYITGQVIEVNGGIIMP